MSDRADKSPGQTPRSTGAATTGAATTGAATTGAATTGAAGMVTAAWRPVRGGNAFEITVARLVQAIKLGLVAVGERLPAERDLAERLRVSRVTLREAIAALREAGYLESRRGRAGGTVGVHAGPPAAGSGAPPDAVA